jgi:HK97 family phage portal protein
MMTNFLDWIKNAATAFRGVQPAVAESAQAKGVSLLNNGVPVSSWGQTAWFSDFSWGLLGDEAQLSANTVVQGVLRWATTSFNEPPLMVVRRGKDGDEEKDFNHAALEVLRGDPAQKMSRRRLMKASLASYVLDGNCYVEMVTDKAGDAAELRWHAPSRVRTVAFDGTDYLSHYVVRDRRGQERRVEPENMVHIADGIDERHPLKGCSGIKSCMRAVMADNQIDLYTHAIMTNPAVIGLIVGLKDAAEADEADVAAVQDKVDQKCRGGGAGSTVVVNSDTTVTKVGFSPKDLDSSAMRDALEERITSVFGVPAIVAGLQQSDAKFSNFQEARRLATEQFLVPHWETFAEEFSLQLGSKAGLKEGEYFAFAVDRVRALQEDANQRHLRIVAAYQGGLTKRSEGRGQMGLESDKTDEVYIDQVQGGASPEVTAAKARMRESRRGFDFNVLSGEQ